ncbi:hypothetical protein JL720_12829 [Aureococcus anophagefferens]|nr:hypothetical protein JL720_12829 [Aureococcus anophagefferens]
MLQSLLKAAGGLATLSVAVFASLVGALYHFQRNLIFPRPDNSNPLPIRKGQLVTVDVSREARPEGVPASSSATSATTWATCSSGTRAGASSPSSTGLRALPRGEPTEETIAWAAERMLKHLHVKLEVPWETTVAFGQSIGGSVALQMTAKGLAGARPFDNAAIAPSVKAPVLCLHGTREIVPYSQGEEIASLLPNSRFVPLRGAGHNDTFNGAHFREVINTLAYSPVEDPSPRAVKVRAFAVLPDSDEAPGTL